MQQYIIISTLETVAFILNTAPCTSINRRIKREIPVLLVYVALSISKPHIFRQIFSRKYIKTLKHCWHNVGTLIQPFNGYNSSVVKNAAGINQPVYPVRQWMALTIKLWDNFHVGNNISALLT